MIEESDPFAKILPAIFKQHGNVFVFDWSRQETNWLSLWWNDDDPVVARLREPQQEGQSSLQAYGYMSLGNDKQIKSI